MDRKNSLKISYESIDRITNNLIIEQLESFGEIDLSSLESNDNSLLSIHFIRNSIVKQRIQRFFNEKSSFNDIDNRKTVILSAICTLKLYVIDNFLCRFNENHFPELKQLVEFLNLTLPKDGLNISKHIPIYYTVGYIRLLEFARCCFTSENLENFSPLENLVWKVWSLRSTVIYQKALQEYESAFHQRMIADCKDIHELVSHQTFSNNFKLELFCEIVNSFFIYKDFENSKFYLTEANKLSRFNFELTGCLGIRTAFQKKEVSQLIVTLQEKENSDIIHHEPNDSVLEQVQKKDALPPIEKLEDDTLLSEVKLFQMPIKPNELFVSNIEQCFFLTTFKYRYLFGHSDDVLLQEELSAMISFILEKSNVWSVLFSILNYRSLIERNSRRRVERSMKQMESLANIVRHSESCSKQKFVEKALFRMENFFITCSPPLWEIEKNLANILYSLGLIKSSLEIYDSLQVWDKIIDCYQRINQPDKAEAIVREMIDKGDNLPYLYCLLGEITKCLEYFEESRSLSNCQYSRASKMLGYHYFSVNDYDKALEFLQESVSVNYLQTDCWYRIGFISLEKEDWQLAAKAYRNVLQFDGESFEAWNNLSKAYINLGDKERALRTLQEAIKCNYDEWKLWDNYIAVALDVRAFNDCLMAFNRLLDLNKHYIDDKILSGIIFVVFENLEDNEGRPASQFLPKILQLFARIASIGDPTHSFWRHYAHILIFNNEQDSTKIVQCLQKCHRKLITSKGWESDPNRIASISKHCVEIYQDFNNVYLKDQTQKNVLNSCKLILNSSLAQIKKALQNLDEEKVDKNLMGKILNNIRLIEENIHSINVDQDKKN